MSDRRQSQISDIVSDSSEAIFDQIKPIHKFSEYMDDELEMSKLYKERLASELQGDTEECSILKASHVSRRTHASLAQG